MRTTVELKPEHRAKLLELAARRGEKGFSSVIAEAIESHLQRTSKMIEHADGAPPSRAPLAQGR